MFIRLVGQVRVVRGEDQRAWREQVLDLQEAEISTGSGFIVSPDGWIVTNHHVIAGETFMVTVRDQRLEVSIDVRRIEVVLPSSLPGQPARRFGASVFAADPELDIAILQVSASDLPYVGLGDSDAVEPGDAARAIGYPLGNRLEVARPDIADVSTPSVSAGVVSAVRADSSGARRFLQVSTVLNPGNSGGPIVDAEGYAIGIAQSRVRGGEAIGFAVPINLVKQMLLLRGVDGSLPAPLLAPGGSIASAQKGVTISVPGGFDDRSPLRLRVDASNPLLAQTMRAADGESAGELVLRIDRLASTESLDQIERALVADGTFERFSGASTPRRLPVRTSSGRRALAGHSTGAAPASGDPSKLVYAIVDFGKEKIVARYIGPADTIAANRSVLHASLASLEMTPLLTAELTRGAPLAWSAVPHAVGDRTVPTPEGWVVEPGLAWHCATSLPPASDGVAMSPVGDFTVSLRATWHAGQIDLTAAARSCSTQPGGFGDASYAARGAMFGVPQHVDGVFVPIPGSGVWQLELLTPVDKRRFVLDLFADWIRSIAGR